MSSVTDLILVVHGIGQGLTATYEAFDFVYATNMFRDVARKQSQSPAISSMMKDSRIQFLPVQWRASLKLDVGEELAKAREGLDNRFTLADITLKNTIPFIRDLTNNVLLDIPLFMSHHRERMIHSVCSLANRTYRLWCARNPGFEKHGRVHIMAHSLGSALVTHILSLERAGIFGCLAIDSLYNIFNPADPVVYLLNPCVDAQKAVELPATAIPNVNEGMISSWSTTVSKMFGGIAPWSSTTTTTATSSKAVGGAKTARNADPEEEGAIEIELASGGLQGNKGTKAERRFAALNPHGTLDFYLPSEGNISEYVDMITAHSSYWNDPSLAAFVLTEIYATQEDLMRTSVGFNP
ncbi:hypothetical protein FRC02_002478 [Tulasnella sp. 418]|nr:hypothetical protein FRC02_002478 [Tulasnella sp. 418]